MSDNKCKFCGEMNLEWDRNHHSVTGKWRLQIHNGCSSRDLRYGKDRCAACRWNCQRVCDMSAGWERHLAKI